MRSYYREKQIYHGEFLDVDIYPVFSEKTARGKRRAKARPTSEVQQLLNEKNRKKRYVYLINNNFTKNDIVIHPTYDDRYLPESKEQAEKDGKNFIRRLKRAFRKIDKELKYYNVFEVSENGRPHHHMILSGGIDSAELQKLWGFGIIRISPLYFNEYGVTGLTLYVDKNPKSRKVITHSRNLKVPKQKKRDGRLSGKNVADMCEYVQTATKKFKDKYPNYEIANIEPFYNDQNGYHYITVKMYKPDFVEEGRRTRGKVNKRAG